MQDVNYCDLGAVIFKRLLIQRCTVAPGELLFRNRKTDCQDVVILWFSGGCGFV